MAHELSFDLDGNAEACFALQPGWHGLGTVLDHPFDSKEAIIQGRMDWEVYLEELRTVSGFKVDGQFATVRRDTGRVLGIVSDRYQIVQNVDAFAFVDSLMSEGNMLYESCGVLRGGKQIWLLARLPSADYVAEGDELRRYIMFSTGHDGTSAIYAAPTSVRVVCANTLRLATSSMTGIRHKGDITAKLEQARLILSGLDAKFADFNSKASLMATKQVVAIDAEEFVSKLFKCDEASERATTIRDNKLLKVRQNYRNERQTLPSIRGTWWSLYNAVSEYVDHQSSFRGTGEQRAENRMMNTLDGPGADLKTKAFDLAYEFAMSV